MSPSPRLSAADLDRARQLAAAAPPPSPELLARLRGLLSGAVPYRSAPLGREGNSDAA